MMISRAEFEEIVASTTPKLLRTTARFGIPSQEREDLIQEAFMALAQQHRPIHNAEAWLVVVVKRQCLMFHRKNRRALADAFDAAVLETIAGTSGDEVEREVLVRELQSALTLLPERCQVMLNARYFRGLGTNEIADEMGYQPSSVRKVCSRCIAQLIRRVAAEPARTGLANAL